MKQNEVCTTFDNQYCINGVHCTVEEANKILADSDYPEIKAIEVEHLWATWGRLPEELGEPGVTNGWWTIPENSNYKHKKRMTLVITEYELKIRLEVERRKQERWKKRYLRDKPNDETIGEVFIEE